jgi:lactoylglutathione lyase
MKKVVPFILCCCILLASNSNRTMAQNAPAVNHIALYVYDLEKSADFYKNVMQLKVIPEPFHDGKHVWFRIGPHSQLHIIKGATAVTEHDINSHLAYSVPVLKNFLTHLDQQKIKYQSFKGEPKTITPRPDGVTQVYIQDPDNFWIEVNDDKF